MQPEGVALAYARDRSGALTPVAALDAVTRRSRAPFTCPACGDALVARLGAVRARHFAHRPGSTCPLTAPETALHFNVKARLLILCAEAFAGARQVTLLARCAACRRLDPRPLAAFGDAAAAEGSVGALRADVLVSRRGAPALALEVLVTHAVDSAKEAALLGAGVPAVEVDARDEWERPGPGGSTEVVCHRTLGLPGCAACRTLARAETDRALGGEAAQVAELEAYRARGLLGPALGRAALDAAAERAGKRPVRHDSRPQVSRRVKSMVLQVISAPDPESSPDDSGSGRAISAAELDALRATFRCPSCGKRALRVGSRLALHPCPDLGDRPVAWRGYDGLLAELGWWKR